MRYNDIWRREEEDYYECRMPSSCKSCGSTESACRCTYTAPTTQQRPKEQVLVNSIVCTKRVQKVAESLIDFATLGIVVGDATLPLITLTPDLGGIVQNRTVLRDTVINIGYVPASITVAGIPLPITTSLPFQEHTSCPGACPEDTLLESPLQVEAIITQPVPLAAIGGVVGLGAMVFKVILSATITVVRPQIGTVNGIDCLQDVNTHRCEASAPQNINFPLTGSVTAPPTP